MKLLPAAVPANALVFPTGIDQILLFFLTEGEVVCANGGVGVVHTEHVGHLAVFHSCALNAALIANAVHIVVVAVSLVLVQCHILNRNTRIYRAFQFLGNFLQPAALTAIMRER